MMKSNIIVLITQVLLAYRQGYTETDFQLCIILKVSYLLM